MSSITKDQVLDALRPIQDPELKKSLVDLGMIEKVLVIDNSVSFQLTLSTRAAVNGKAIQEQAETLVKALPGVERVKATISSKTINARKPVVQPIPGIKNILAVSSGKGGVGKSTMAVNLACALKAQGAKVGILDADIYGPNVPIMMGLQGSKLSLVDENDKGILPENYGIKVMSISFLVKPDQALIWRGPILHKSIAQFFSDMAWGELDYLLIDLPPGTGDAQLSITQLAPITGGIIVTTPQDVSLADCRRAHAMFKQTEVPVLGVIENMSYFVNRHGEREDIFGEGGGTRFAEELNTPLLTEVPLVPVVRQNADQGQPIVISQPESEPAQAITEAAKQIQAAVAQLNQASTQADKELVTA